MAENTELVFQIILAALIVALLAFGGEKFESDYWPTRKWVVGANPFKRGWGETK